jgi:hypothetical protein
MLFLTLFVFSFIFKAESLCYHRNGQLDRSGEAQPCDPEAEYSHCCEAGRHLCLSNKLCLDTTHSRLIEGGSSTTSLVSENADDVSSDMYRPNLGK